MPISIGATQESSFANPIGPLTDCHRRIERFLGVLVSVAAEARGRPLNAGRRQAMETALSYFHRAAPLHTADEEEDLFPELRRADRPDIEQIVARVSRLESEHSIATAWHHQVHDIGERRLRQDYFCRMRLRSYGGFLHPLLSCNAATSQSKRTKSFQLRKKRYPLSRRTRSGVEWRCGAVPDL